MSAPEPVPLALPGALVAHHCTHPLALVALAAARAASADPERFRARLHTAARVLAVEAMRALPTTACELTTPLGPATGVTLAHRPLLVPVLRAGLGLLGGVLECCPDAEVGTIGATRSESTLEVSLWGDKVPTDLGERPVFVLDPMLATGGTLTAVLDLLAARGARELTCLALLVTPEGRAALSGWAQSHPECSLTLFFLACDVLDEAGWIRPGLGDAGDRLFG